MYKTIIVEDEELIRKGLVFSIPWTEQNCNVIEDCANGTAGMEAIRKHRPDIVITDVNMPVVDGLEMIRQTYEEYEYAAIILSGYSDFEYAQTAIKYGVLEYLLKPLNKAEIIAAVGKAKHLCDIRTRYHSQNRAYTKDIVLQELNTDGYHGTDPLVRKIIDYIREHYSEKITVSDFVRELNYSDTFLNRKFKAAMGTTLMEYVNRYRIRQAIHMMEEEKTPVQEVSWRCGIGEYKYFNTVFKKYLGCSPREFMADNI